MVLFIDSSDFDRLILGLVDHAASARGRVWAKTILTNRQGSHKILMQLSKFLNANKHFKTNKFAAISKIYVVSGPGSFTGVRTGIAIALGISFATGIPLFAVTKDQVPKDLINILKAKAKKINSSFEPDYGAEPNINN